MVPPIHLGAWSMALVLWLPFELLLYRVSLSEKQVIGRNVSLRLRLFYNLDGPSLTARQANTSKLMPEAVCCRLQTCKCGFDIRVALCSSVPSLIVRNANPTKLWP